MTGVDSIHITFNQSLETDKVLMMMNTGTDH